MDSLYKVILKNNDGDRVAQFDSWRGLNVLKTLNSVATHSFTIDGDDDRLDLFTTDAQLEVWRCNPDANLDWYIEYEAFHRSSRWENYEAGAYTFESIGRSYEDILRRRYVMFPAGSTGAMKNMDAAQAIWEYVNENAGPGAGSPPRILASGIFPNLSMGPCVPCGKIWSGAKEYKHLYKVVTEIAAATGVDFAVLGTGPNEYTFYTYSGGRGTDRTTRNLNPATGLNAYGNPPLIFDLDFGNVVRAAYVASHTGEANTAFVLGRGSGDDRPVALVQNAPARYLVPTNQCEIVVDARSDDPDDMAEEGLVILEEQRARYAFSFKPATWGGFVWGRDAQLGDRITARYRGKEYHKQIVSVDISVNADDGEVIGLEFIDVPLAMASEIPGD